MLLDYVQAAMRRAKYEILPDDGHFYGEIPECNGVYAHRLTLEECRTELQEVLEEWIPLGVWRFREISREALRKPPQRFSGLDEALGEIGKRLKWPLERWLTQSVLLRFFREQKRMDQYLTKGS